MSEIKLSKNRYGKLALLTIASLAFLAGGIWTLSLNYVDRYDVVMSYFCLVFGAVATLLSMFQILDRRVQIRITSEGIWDRTTRMEMIPWEHIQEAYPFKISGQNFIALGLIKGTKSDRRIYKWVSFLNKTVGAQKVNININLIRIHPQKLSDLINLLSTTEPDLRTYVIKHWNPDSE